MKMDLAERLAATAVDGISVETAHAVIQDFLAHLARCPLCENTGRFQFGRDVVVELREHQRGTTAETHVPAGTISDCPLCGSPMVNGKTSGDPEWVKWYCAASTGLIRCQYAQASPDGPGEHAACGWRIMLPLSE